MAIPRVRGYSGPPILSYGFRPFFFFGAVEAALVMLVWLPVFFGRLEVSSLFGPVGWHSHELFFGYLAAIITGYLFTAVPNWTGRMPLQGRPLLALLIVWIAGRLAVTFSVHIGWALMLIIDLSFFTLILAAIGIEIISGRNWRNMKILIPATLFWLANLSFHLEMEFSGIAARSERLAVSVAVFLIMAIGGRLVPSFTRNYLARCNPGRLPAPFGRFDILSVGVAALALILWCFSAEGAITAGLMATAALLQLIRLARWVGYRTGGDFLVAILHVSYLFIPAGFLLLAAASLWPGDVPLVAGMHLFAVGAIGSMTLSVMIRTSIGLTGRVLRTTLLIRLILLAIWIAALCRVAAAFYPPGWEILLAVAAAGWVLAFAGFSVGFARILFRPRGG